MAFPKIDSLKSLSVPLPKEVSVLIESGNIEEADKRIDLVLERTADPLLRDRLLWEKAVLPVLEESYPFTRSEALTLIRKDIPEFSGKTFDKWDREGILEYRILYGEKHYFKRFWPTLKKVYPEISKMAGLPEKAKTPDHILLEQTIQDIKSGKITGCRHRIHAELTVSNSLLLGESHVVVHLPFPKPGFLMQNIRLLGTSQSQYFLAPENVPSRTICFDQQKTDNHHFYVEYEYECRSRFRDLSKEALLSSSSLEEFGRELSEQLPHIRFTPYLKMLAADITKDSVTLYEKARAIYDFCTQNITYSFMPPYLLLRDIAETCAVSRKGDCGVQALLFITLCRICGIPARFQSGLYTNEEAEAGCHDWAEICISSEGWAPVDLSFGSSAYREKAWDRWNFYFGNLDCFRMAANSGFQEEFLPAKSGLRCDPYDNQTGEAEVNGNGLSSDQITSHPYLLERSIF